MQKEHDEANKTLTIFATVIVGGLLIGGLIGFAIKSLLPTPKVEQVVQPIGDNTAYLLPLMDAFDTPSLIALVPGLGPSFEHASFLAFDERGNMHYVVVFWPSSGNDVTKAVIHEFKVGDPRLISSVQYVHELSGDVYLWYGNLNCWILAPYKNKPSPPAGCAF